MKKLLLFITVLFFGISTANAQIEKASEGTIYEVMFTPNLETAGQFALQEGHIVRRDFNGDGKDDLYCNSAGTNMIMLVESTDIQKNYINFVSVSIPNNNGEMDINDLTVWCQSQDVLIGNFDGNGYADLLCNNDSSINI